MSESAMWEAIRPVLKSCDPVRIESPISPGVPDVNYTLGWIELKYLDAWPVRAGTPVKISHFTKKQRVWLIRRRMSGGNAFLLLKVGAYEWLLFDGRVAAENIDKVNKEQLTKLCLGRWLRLPKIKELELWILR
jgi:hypothetical protein